LVEIPPGDEFYFQWHITEKCNLRCAHCYHESYESAGELTFAELEATLRAMEKALRAWGRVGSFSLTGGEPFMRRAELFRIMDRLDGSDAVGYYDILTNGSLLERDDISRLRTAGKLRRVQVSLESHIADENDRIRGRDAFARTVACIDVLKDAGLEVAVMATITKANMNSIAAMIDFLADHRVDTFAVERFIPEGSGSGIRDLMLTKDEARRVLEAVHEAGIAERRLRVLMYRPLFALINSHDPTVGAMCSIGTNALTVMHDGTVYPCRRLPIPLGNILADGIFKIWYDSELLWKVRDPSKIEGCSDCDLVPVCRGCRAMAYHVRGDYLSADPHCWRDAECTA